VVLADRIRRIVGDPLRSFFAEPSKPSLPGDYLVAPFLAAGMAIPLRQVAPIMTIAYTAIRVGLLAWRRSGRGLPAGLAIGRPAGEQ
jgi:hypothetical protein